MTYLRSNGSILGIGVALALWIGGGLAWGQTPSPEATDLTIAIARINNSPAQESSTIVYQIGATNAGTHDASSISVVVTLATGLTFDGVLGAAPGWTCEQAVGVVVCTRALLPAQTTESLEIVVRTAIGPRTVQTLATINSVTPDVSIDNNIAIATTDLLTLPIGAPGIQITTPTTEGTARASSPRVTLAGSASPEAPLEISRVSWTNDRGGAGEAIGTTDWTAANIPLQAGLNVITVTAWTGDIPRHDVIVISLTGYYLSEGATGTFFDTDIAIVNPNLSEATGTISFLTPQGTAIEQPFNAPPRSRQTIAVDSIAGMASTEFSTVVTSATGAALVVERTMRWDATGYGGHGAEATVPATQWYFAEGAQGFFSTYVLLFNPQGETNRATVRYLRENAMPLTRTYDLAPLARFTIDASADSELVNRSFGMTITFDRPGLAERAMYFGGPPLWRAGHGAAGVTQLSPSWFFAEGATGSYFETFILLSNPNDTPANVTVTFLPDTGTPVTIQRTIPETGRLTINIEADAPSLANAAVATQVASTQPIVAERAQYWPFTPDLWFEAHASAGVTAAGLDWGLAEGRVGSAQDYETYILLANPGTSPADVTITFVRETGAPLTKAFTVPPTSRFNVTTGPGSLVPELANERFGAVIHATSPIMVERAMYWDANGEVWSAGTNVTATRLTP